MKKIVWMFLSAALVCLLIVSVALFKNYQANEPKNIYATYLKRFNSMDGVAVVHSLVINENVGNAHLVTESGRKIQFAFLHQMGLMDKLFSRYSIFDSNGDGFFLYKIDDVYSRGDCVIDMVKQHKQSLPFADTGLNLANAVQYNEELYQLMDSLVGNEAYELEPKKFCQIEKAVAISTNQTKPQDQLDI